jgi:hypothetical protein
MIALNFEEALAQELKTIDALQKRVYPLVSPEANAGKGVPYLIYGSSEGQRTKTIGEGYQQGRTVRGELNVVAGRYADLKGLTRAVLDLLVGFEGRQIGTDGPLIQELTYGEPVELYEDAPGLYRCVIDFEVYF